MTQHITLTSEQAQTLNTTGHLEGFKELCEWQPDFEITAEMRTDSIDGFSMLITPSGKCGVLSPYLTPTRAIGQVYACKEPLLICRSVAAGEEGGLRAYYEADGYGSARVSGWESAETMPDWAVRLHAKIATEPTLEIHEGTMFWTFDLVKAQKEQNKK